MRASPLFEPAGNRTALTSSIGGTADLANSYLYDALNRLKQAQQSSNGGNSVASKQANFAYNASGQVTSLNGYSDLTGTNLVASSTYGYDNDNRLTSLDHALGSSGSTTLDYSLGYDAASQITSLTTPDGSSTLGYDHGGQLLSASLTSESYSYDANGNRTSGSASTNADNQLASDANDSYTYDKNGNLTSAVRNDGTGSTDYTWDYRNRLTDVTFKDGSGAVTGSIHYAYDDNNNRISQVVKDASGTVTLTEFYIYDGSNLLLVLDGSGNVKQRYFNGPNENQVLAEETNIVSSGAGDTHWALTDHEGSVRDVVDNSGSVLDHIKYDSFGNILSQSNSADAMRLAYTGQQYDSQTGLYYDHARYYDPSTGRFLSTDPAGFTAGDENLYRYVGNSPVDSTDPTGLCADSPTGQGDDSGPMTWDRAMQIARQAKADLNIANGTASADDFRTRRDELISDGMSPDQANAAIAPLITEANDMAAQHLEDVRYATGDLTSLERLEGSGSILANTFTFGYSDQWGWTQSTRYQEDGFDLARAGATLSREAALTVITLGAADVLNAARCGAYGYDAMVATRALDAGIGTVQVVRGTQNAVQGVSEIVNGNYAQGAADLIGGVMDVYGGTVALNGALGPGCFMAGTLVLTPRGRMPIERVQLGQRVLTAPAGQEQSDPAIDASEYRVIRLRYVDPKSSQDMELAFLRRRELVEGLGAGDTIRLTVLELELDDRAMVLAVEAAPAIEAGEGRLVTGTIRSRNMDLRLLKLQGLDKRIEVTGGHPVFSEDRSDFVPVRELRSGERLRTRSGTAVVELVDRYYGEHAVFNLEVGQVHRYYVSDADLLVHNANAGTCGGIGPVLKGQQGVAKSEAEALANGEKILGDEVTFELPSGNRTRSDLVTEPSGGGIKIREAKNGPTAALTPAQTEMQQIAKQGGTVIPRGARAAGAGFTPGVPVKINAFEEDRW